MDWYGYSDIAVLEEIGNRIKAKRLRLNRTQEWVGKQAGVGRSSINKIESGQPVSFIIVIQVLRVLNELDIFEHLFPDKDRIDAKTLLKMKGKVRKHASGKKLNSKNRK
ncbi:MAG: helix-turn-helix domain-containing protein [Bacteroidales bacterium]